MDTKKSQSTSENIIDRTVNQLNLTRSRKNNNEDRVK